MIEFSGYLTDQAKEHFVKKSSSFGRKIILTSIILLTPFFVYFAIQTYKILLYIYPVAIVVTLVFSWLPKSKKEIKSIIPRRIYTDGESITCISDKYVETRFIDDVKEVHDYGTYYDLVFPFGKISEKFICQKSLLTKGSLQEFEKLFEDKIKIL